MQLYKQLNLRVEIFAREMNTKAPKPAKRSRFVFTHWKLRQSLLAFIMKSYTGGGGSLRSSSKLEYNKNK